MPELTPETVVSRTGDVLAEDVLGETVLLDVPADRYTRLNRSAGVVWAGLERPATVAELAALLAARFTLAGPRALEDAAELVRQLADRGLVALS
jgi:hypothetical protein